MSNATNVSLSIVRRNISTKIFLKSLEVTIEMIGKYQTEKLQSVLLFLNILHCFRQIHDWIVK